MSSNGGVEKVEWTYRMRFYNYNMANSSAFEGLHQLQGGNGGGFESWVQEPLADGSPVDLVFATLSETRLQLGPWVREYRTQPSHALDVATYQNSLKEADKKNELPWTSVLDGMAEKYNGNLKTLLLFSRSRFRRDPESLPLFGRLPDKRVAGLALPNPKKAFIGRSLLSRHEELHFCFAGAHFPISDIAAALEDPKKDNLEEAKILLARTLRKVLCKAQRMGLLDDGTILILQGDLNSRTVLRPSGNQLDVLSEVMADKELQAAIRVGLPLLDGEWFEPSNADPSELPVTYKFLYDVGETFLKGESSLTLKSLLQAASDVELSPKSPSSERLDFKEGSFRPFRFPASADRLLVWAPTKLARRLRWNFPKGGYEVIHTQGGSDHRPVVLEAALTVVAAAPDTSEPCRPDPSPELIEAVTQDDADNSDSGESPGLFGSLARGGQSWSQQQLVSSFGWIRALIPGCKARAEQMIKVVDGKLRNREIG
ncbi:unnamed protein product [Symbiodinium necroappetens]|uniref:Uncharacterized protein n=1 Tax=Symbiodinium necroappetens TaxID=1628268 RepID=A0A812VRV5_9DINO|nr:unnamed protein product [Symbiodinium necroappetens]